jgi:hypothetical protein
MTAFPASSARCVYLNRLGLLCQQKGLRFYLQAKEFNFPTDLLLAHPHLFEPGHGVRFDVDFWSGYLAEKVSPFASVFPRCMACWWPSPIRTACCLFRARTGS